MIFGPSRKGVSAARLPTHLSALLSNCHFGLAQFSFVLSQLDVKNLSAGKVDSKFDLWKNFEFSRNELNILCVIFA